MPVPNTSVCRRKESGVVGFKFIRGRKSVMIHKAMEEFYVFVSSEDSLEHFGDNSGGQFRVQFPRTYPVKDKWECALLKVSFVPAFETPTSSPEGFTYAGISWEIIRTTETRTNRFSNPSASCTKNCRT
jgi:hypothetical protein